MFGEGGEFLRRAKFERVDRFERGIAVAVVFLLIEESEEAIILTLCDGVELMVVTLRASERQAEPDRRGRVDPVHGRFDSKLFQVDTPFMIDLGIAVKASGNELIGGRFWH